MTRSSHTGSVMLDVDQWSAPGADHDTTPPDGTAWDLLIIGGGTAEPCVTVSTGTVSVDAILLSSSRGSTN